MTGFKTSPKRGMKFHGLHPVRSTSTGFNRLCWLASVAPGPADQCCSIEISKPAMFVPKSIS